MTDHINFPVDFVEDVTSTSSVDEVLQVMARWLPSFLPADRASIALMEPDGMLQVFATNGDEVIPVNLRLPQENTHLGQALRMRSYSIAEDLRQRDEIDSKMLVKGGLLTAMVVPLISKDEVYGTLNVASATQGNFRAEHGRVATVMARWVASQIRIHKQIEEITLLANTDPLTGILNRRAFLNRATQAVREMRSTSLDLAMILLDLDWFKRINDTYGHSGGDAVLRAVVADLSRHIPTEAVFARLGGEEFAVLLQEADLPQAANLAEELRDAIALVGVRSNGEVMRCTASLGLAMLRQGDGSIDDLMRRADRALYLAKDRGRNRVETLAA